MTSLVLRVRSISSPRVLEGEAMVFDVALTAPTFAGSTMSFSLSGSATAGLDYRSRPEVSYDGGRTYTAISGSTLSLPPNICDLKIRVNTFNDRLIESTDAIVLETRMDGITERSTGSVLDDDKGFRVVSVTGQDVVEGNNLTYRVNLAGGPTQPCRTPGSGCPPEQWTCTTSNGKGSIDLGDYKIELQEHNSVWILTNKITGACTRIWGDPHVDVKNDGINDFDFKKDMTFQLADGTKITVETVEWGKSGMTLSAKLIITDWCNQNAMVVSGLGWDSDGANNLQVQKLDGQGRSLDVNTSDGAFTLYENSEGGWHIFDGRVPDQNLINQLESGALRDTSADVTLNLVAGTASLNNDYRGQIEVSMDDGRTWSRIDANKLVVPTKLDHFLVRIPTIDDTQVENRETVSLKAEAVCGSATGEGGILDNDAPPPPPLSVVSVSSTQANEGDPLTFSVALNRAANAATSVTLALTNGTASAGSDYSNTGLQVSFDGGRTFDPITGTTVNVPAGATGFQVKVAGLEDTVFEGNETFTLRASLGNSSATGVGTICEDDSAPKVIGVNSVQANEGDALCFTVNLSNASTTSTTVALNLAGGTATAGTDFATTGLQVSFDGGRTFSAITGTSVNVPAGATSFQVKVASIEDTLVEPNETFTLQASSNGGSATGTGTIVNDDVAPPPPPPPPLSVVSVSSTQANEGDPLTFNVSLNNVPSSGGTVTLALSNGTASAGTDYSNTGLQVSFDGGRTFSPITGATVSVPGSATGFQVRVAGLEDTVFEGNETFTLRASSGTSAATGVGTICEDDSAPKVIGINSAQANEGDALCFTVNLSNASISATTVALNLASGTAIAGTDFATTGLQVSFDGGRTFSPITGTSVSVPAGATTFQVKVASIEDTVVEPNETFTLQASSNGGSATGTGTIVNDDVAPPPPPPPPLSVVSVSSTQANEGDPLCFNVSLANVPAAGGLVTLALNNGTATAGTDYSNTGLQVSFDGGRTFSPITGTTVNVPSGATGFQVKVAGLEDTVFEGNETFTLTANAGTSSASGIGTICEDDTAPRVVSITNHAANEGDALNFVVSLSNSSTTATTVNLNLASGTATSGVDFATNTVEVSFDGGRTYSALTGPSVSVPAGASSFQVKVASIEDSLVEADETFTLQAATNGSSATGTGTILNDDARPPLDPTSFTIVGAAKILEGAPRSDFTIRLAQALDYDVTVTLKISDLSANKVNTEATGQSYVRDQGTYNDWRTVLPDATVGKGSLTKDYTVYDSSGQIVTGDTVTVTIRAGSVVSNSFGVQAWQEVQRVSQRGAEIEGDETFGMQITGLNGQTPSTPVGTTVTVCDNHVGRISPIIIDMDGDGVQTTSIENSQARFDMDLDGVKDQTGWVSKGDALLAHDANQDGSINDRSELFGGKIGEGFAKLDSFDSNRDGLVDARDDRFSELSVWQDKDGDGTTDAGELIKLDAAGIASLRTSYNIDPEIQNGNMLIERSSASFADGREAAVADAYFEVQSGADKAGKPALADLIVDDAHDAIPLGKLGNTGGVSAAVSKDQAPVAGLDTGADLDNLLHKPLTSHD